MPEINESERHRAGRGIAWIDGNYVPIRDARLSVLDWGLIRSDCTYDVVHVWNGAFFMLDAHIERFIRSCETLRLSMPANRHEIKDILTSCVGFSGLRDSYVEMVCTRGKPCVEGSRDYRECTNQFFAYAIPFVWLFPVGKASTGIRTVIPKTVRIPKESIDPRVKNFHWGDFTYGLFEAYDTGADTCILCNSDGEICEGPGFNVFAVIGSKVITPDVNVLEGVTRRAVQQICEEMGKGFIKRALSAEEFMCADEAFVSTTAGGIYPINEVNGRRIGKVCPGVVTKVIQERYWAMHNESRYAEKVRYGSILSSENTQSMR